METSDCRFAVCFTGHRQLDRDFDRGVLRARVEELISEGYRFFICGGALGFDTAAAETVLEFKEEYPGIRLHLYLPCNNQDAKWSAADRRKYREILKRADYVSMPAAPYWDGCMRERNYKMADASSVCVCYLNSEIKSGTAQTVRYARQRGLKIINVSLAETW